MKANLLPIVIIGTGGVATEQWGMLENMGHRVEGFVCESGSKVETHCGVPVLGDDLWLMNQRHLACLIGNGNPRVRKQIHDKFRGLPLYWPSFVHPGTVILGHLDIADGSTVLPGGVIQPHVKIGGFTHINMGVTIGHDTTIGHYCVINPHAGISGNVTIKDGVLVGAGATIIEENVLHEQTVLGAGAVLTHDVPAGQVWAGVPARILQR